MQTSHLWTLYKNHGQLNQLLQTTTVALCHLRDESDKKGMGEIFKRSVKALNEPWGELPPVQNIDDEFLDAAISNVAELSIVRIFSSIEEYLTNLKSDSDRWDSFSQNKKEKEGSEEDPKEEKGLSKKCTELNIKSESIQQYLVIDEYFSFMRNCIAHRRSSITKALDEYSKSDSFLAALSFIQKENKKGKAPELPILTHGEKLRIKPRLPIFYSAIAKKICDEIDKIYLSKFGTEGAIYLAAHKTLLGRRVNSLEKTYQAFERPICDHLQEKYRMREINGRQVIKVLEKLGLSEKCEERFEKLQPKQKENKI